MIDITYIQGVLEHLNAEYRALLAEREELDKRHQEMDRKITALQESLQALNRVIDDDAQANGDPGETGAVESPSLARMDQTPYMKKAKTLIACCRQILHRKGDWMSPIDVRDALNAAKFDFADYKSNPLSSIHTTLRRIVESGQAWSHRENSAGENLYRWKKSGEISAPRFEPRGNEVSAPKTETR